jgi:glycosyltransferase involved in cell wall biosynthesis
VTDCTLEDVQNDYHCLDTEEFSTPENIRLISHEKFDPRPGLSTVEYVPPGPVALLFRFSAILFNLLYAWRLLRHAKRNTILVLNGGTGLWLPVGLLNRFVMRRKRTIFLWDVFVEVDRGWKRAIMSAAMSSVRLSVLWSRRQIEPHAEWLRLPEERFVFLPYKANHCRKPAYDLPVGNYVFSGGNGKRDYQTLADAVRDTGIPVIISATDAAVRKRIEELPNVIPLAAWEPAFAQLQAGARFTVVAMIDTGLKGGGETNMCNGMWHGKPVIAVDRMAAEDYIIEGETGYIVPPGDAALLRRRILELWNDTEKCQEMGRKAKQHAEANFTHEAFIRRLLRLATLCGTQ